MIGIPIYYNLALVPTDNVSGMDAEILIQLSEGHRPSVEYMRPMRRRASGRLPGRHLLFPDRRYRQPGAEFRPVRAAWTCRSRVPTSTSSYDIGRQLLASLKTIPGVVDAHIQQVMSYPGLKMNVDRQRAAEVGLTQSAVANNMLTSLSSSAGVSPSFFLSPAQWRELLRRGADAAAAGFNRVGN